MSERVLCCWCPDWSVEAWRRREPALRGTPVAVFARGTRGEVIRAASREAREEGVRPGLRRREAEARLPGLVALPVDPVADARAFEGVAATLDAITPNVVLERPGALAFPTRGPSRYFGGDDALCRRVHDALAGVEAGVGIADGTFAARLAARAAAGGDDALVVAPSGTPAFLATWSVRVLAPVVEEGAALADLLERLGLWTLGAFAALPAPSVLARFGMPGALAHRLACGLEARTTTPAPPPPDLVETCELDPPATRVDEAAFAAKMLADRLLARLADRGLTCLHVVVEAETDHGERLVRTWRHEGALTAAALATRVRWQLDGWLGATGGDDDVDAVTAGLRLVRLVPDQVVPATGRQLGLWGGDVAAYDRADRVLARVQGMVGHTAVATIVPGGGRVPVEQARWVPWGEARDTGSVPGSGETPAWPGAVPGPAPARVHEPPLPATLLDAAGAPVVVSARGEASAPPARLLSDRLPGGGGPVDAWAGPWLQDVRWWDRSTRRRRALWQIVVDDVACLVAIEAGRAGITAIYD